MPKEDQLGNKCFLALPFTQNFVPVREAIIAGAKQAGFQVVSLDQGPVLPSGTIREAIIGELTQADCIIADITDRNPNIFFELGLAQAMGKGLLLISREKNFNDIPFDLREFRVIIYSYDSVSLDSLSKKISLSLREYRRFPRPSIIYPGFSYSSPFFIEWELLSEREVENLCRELLAQMGFQRLEWGKISPEVDLVAEIPKKDPDGYEYRELWLISMGLHAPVEILLEIITHDPDFLIHRVKKYSEQFDKYFSKAIEAPVTFLFITYRKDSKLEEFKELRERLEKRRQKGLPGHNLRIRVWDQEYLTSLIHRFPQIGYKYFSDQGRIRSKTRKSYEELYKENSNLLANQTKLITDLEGEKNRRIRAERDAVWKDISFSAAHKIGNPIFAIETDLDPLVKRIREQRIDEVEEVVKNIHSSVEKAKAFVEQFKSLARAQEIKPISTLLYPILEDACRSLCSKDISCKIECSPELAVLADPERLAECFDELVANAAHWFDKPEKKIEIKTVYPVPEPLPSFVDSSKIYVLVHVKDNGCGIPILNKQKIFDAFFTTYDHGTGLGLALVRRIIDGHGGGIIETGIPNQGADFEVYLPLPDQKNNESKSSLNI
ncbi:MAG: ATP-binding protein [bacterium]